jgi:hypothetical protein
MTSSIIFIINIYCEGDQRKKAERGGHVVRMRERPHGRHRHRCEDEIKMELRK